MSTHVVVSREVVETVHVVDDLPSDEAEVYCHVTEAGRVSKEFRSGWVAAAEAEVLPGETVAQVADRLVREAHRPRTAEAYIVVAGGAHFGPFDTRDAAHDWTSHPDRTVEVRGSYRVVPLFGGLLLDPLPGEPATHQIDVPTYPGDFALAVAS